MKKTILFLILAFSGLAASAQTYVMDRLVVHDSIYLDGRWIKKETIDSIGMGGGSGAAVDTIWISNDTMYYKKNGNTYYDKLPSGGGGVSFIIGTNPDMFLQNDVTKANIGGVAVFTDGSITGYEWQQVAGTPTTTLDSSAVAFTTLSGLEAGQHYKYLLTATNDLDDTKTSDTLYVTVDSIRLKPTEYYINDSSQFDFSPTLDGVQFGWTGVVGNPATSTVSATDTATGWGVTTIGNWNPDTSGTSATMGGETDPELNDFGGFYNNADTAMKSVFVADSTSFNPTAQNWNMKLTGLDENQQYIIQITSSITGDDADFMRNNYYAQNNGSQNILRQMDAYGNTSWYVQFDTVHPNSNGEIKLMVGGVDSAGSFFRNGYISALKVWQVSKTNTSGYKISLQFFKDSGTINLNDGTVSRKALVYYPADYNPGTKYPVLFYITGAESSGDNIDAVRQFGPARNREMGHGVFGLKANGDTVRFITVVPQYPLNSSAFTADEFHNMLNDFKTNVAATLPADTSSVYATGFSYGGGGIMRWMYMYPKDLKAGVSISPVSSGLTSTQIDTMAHRFKDDSTFMLILPHSDQSVSIATEVYRAISKTSKGFASLDQWYGRPHNGFNYQMDTAFSVPLIGQNIFDYMVNPTKNYKSAAKFAFTGYSHDVRGDLGEYNVTGNPSSAVRSVADTISGITCTSISTANWGGETSSGITTEFPTIYGSAFGTYAYQQCWFTNAGNYAANGANMRFTGLQPNTQYVLTVLSSTALADRVTRIGIDGSNYKIINSTNNDQNFAILTATSDGSGVIDWYIYPEAGHSGYGILNAVIIRKK